jgi:hypothetical protein
VISPETSFANASALLDRLHQQEQERTSHFKRLLESRVATLGVAGQPYSEEAPPPSRPADRPKPQPRPDRGPAPYEPMPFGVTISEPKAFHPFGPKVRSLLIREALGERW